MDGARWTPSYFKHQEKPYPLWFYLKNSKIEITILKYYSLSSIDLNADLKVQAEYIKDMLIN